MKRIFTFLILVSALGTAKAQITFTAGTLSNTQNFDGLENTGTGNAKTTVPTNWDFVETGTGANSTFDASNGSLNTGNTYSFGTTSASDRAFGGLLSGSVVTTVGARFLNSTGGNITSIRVQFTSEQWRLGATGRIDRMDFQYSTDATSLSTGTWVDVDACDALGTISTGTVGALDGNAVANKNSVDNTIGSLNIANNGEFWIRWVDFNATNSDDGIGIDDVTITVTSALPISLVKFEAQKLAEKVKLTWTTATEINNQKFIVERASNGEDFTSIAEIKGAGNSKELNEYTFVDANPLKGTAYYRLTQVDFDGTSTSFEPVAVSSSKGQLSMEQVAGSFEQGAWSIYSPITTEASLDVKDINGKVIYSEKIQLKEGYQNYKLNLSTHHAGIYVLQLIAGKERLTKKVKVN